MPFEWALSAQVFHEVQTVFRVALYFSTIQFAYAPVKTQMEPQVPWIGKAP